MSMFQSNAVDDKNNIFEYPDLNRIIREPKMAALITLFNQVNTNAQTGHITL